MGKKVNTIKAAVKKAAAAPAVKKVAKEKPEEVKAIVKPMQTQSQKALIEKAEQSAFMLKERKLRTVFVGNVPIDASAK